jgi:hypothetical protein
LAASIRQGLGGIAASARHHFERGIMFALVAAF